MLNFNSTFQERMEEMLDILFFRIVCEMPESGEFDEIKEFLYQEGMETDDIYERFAIRAYKMPDNVDNDPAMRYIEAIVYDPQACYKSSFVVAHGYKKQLLDIIKSSEFRKKLNPDYGKLLDALRDD